VAQKKRRKVSAKQDTGDSVEQPSDLRLIARLLGLLLVKDRPMGEQAGMLATAGFTNTEIAELVGTSPASASQQVYAWRRGRGAAKIRP
jgi:hypothetical protein